MTLVKKNNLPRFFFVFIHTDKIQKSCLTLIRLEEKACFHDNRVILVAILELHWHPAVDINRKFTLLAYFILVPQCK